MWADTRNRALVANGSYAFVAISNTVSDPQALRRVRSGFGVAIEADDLGGITNCRQDSGVHLPDVAAIVVGTLIAPTWADEGLHHCGPWALPKVER